MANTDPKQVNSLMLKTSQKYGMTWHHTTWLATAHNFKCLPEGVRALSYEGQNGGACEFMDSEIQHIAKDNEGPEELLNDLANAALTGWVVLVKLPNRVYLECGDYTQGISTLDHWFYGDDLETIVKNSEQWAVKHIERMKQNSFYHVTQNAIKDTLGIS